MLWSVGTLEITRNKSREKVARPPVRYAFLELGPVIFRHFQRLASPPESFVVILPDAYAFRVTQKEIVCCAKQTLSGSCAQPPQPRFIVPMHALSGHVEHAEVILSLGKSLLRRQEKPGSGFLATQRGAEAARAANAEFKLRSGVTLFRCLAKPPDCLGIVLPGAFAYRVTPAKKKLRAGIALPCGFEITLKNLRLLKLHQHAVEIAELFGGNITHSILMVFIFHRYIPIRNNRHDGISAIPWGKKRKRKINPLGVFDFAPSCFFDYLCQAHDNSSFSVQLTKCLIKITKGLLAYYYPEIDRSDSNLQFVVDLKKTRNAGEKPVHGFMDSFLNSKVAVLVPTHPAPAGGNRTGCRWSAIPQERSVASRWSRTS
jgi:hypothetical protein